MNIFAAVKSLKFFISENLKVDNLPIGSKVAHRMRIERKLTFNMIAMIGKI